MDMFPYKLAGKLTTTSFFRAAFHCGLAWLLLEFWDFLFHATLPDFWADKLENLTAAMIIVITHFLVGLYNDPEMPER